MRKYIVAYLHRTPGRTSMRQVTVKALSVADALVRFERASRSDMVLDSAGVEVVAVWQCSACECRTKRSVS